MKTSKSSKVVWKNRQFKKKELIKKIKQTDKKSYRADIQ